MNDGRYSSINERNVRMAKITIFSFPSVSVDIIARNIYVIRRPDVELLCVICAKIIP